MNRNYLAALLCGIICALPLHGGALTVNDDGTGGTCDFGAHGRTTCFHEFSSSDDADTADSGVFPVGGCEAMTILVDGDGVADLFVMEYRTAAGGGGTVWTCDLNNDGEVNAIDRGIPLDGTPGRSGCRSTPVGKPFMELDVQHVPGSGSAYVTLVCKER